MDIYARMNDTLNMAHAQRRADESYGKLAQLKADILAARVPVSRAEALWGYGTTVSPADIEFARTRL